MEMAGKLYLHWRKKREPFPFVNVVSKSEYIAVILKQVSPREG